MEMSLVMYIILYINILVNIVVAYYNVPYQRNFYVSKKAVRSGKFSFSFSSGFPFL